MVAARLIPQTSGRAFAEAPHHMKLRQQTKPAPSWAPLDGKLFL